MSQGLSETLRIFQKIWEALTYLLACGRRAGKLPNQQQNEHSRRAPGMPIEPAGHSCPDGYDDVDRKADNAGN